jgi:tetratricopeptide (TPR) repeat protein
MQGFRGGVSVCRRRGQPFRISLTTIALAFSFHSSLADADEAFRVLAEADRLVWRNNWVKAGPLFARAESLFTQRGDSRNALYARISRFRAEVDYLSYQEVSEYFDQQLTTPMVAKDAKLRLRCLVAKASIDILLNPPTVSKPLWEATRDLANTIGDQGWAWRASGELGIIAFLDGDTASAMKLVAGALAFAKTSGDVGSEIQYISLIGRALAQFGRNDDAIGYFDRAITTAEKNADVGFPHIAYVGKAEALINLGKTAEARKWLDRGL